MAMTVAIRPQQAVVEFRANCLSFSVSRGHRHSSRKKPRRASFWRHATDEPEM